MTGMGELCTELAKRLDVDGDLIDLDLSLVLWRHASKHTFGNRYRVIETAAWSCPIQESSVDNVYSPFGLKPFDDDQLAALASEVRRILRPGGAFAFLEISVPPRCILRVPYMFYLNQIIPLLGRLFLGNPDNYRLLGVYTTAFGNCSTAATLFRDAGLQVELRSYFFGCATGFVGRRPIPIDGLPPETVVTRSIV